MRSLLKGVSALIFLLGCLAMVAGLTYVWLFLIVSITKELGWIVGLVALLATIYGQYRFREHLESPWRVWHAIWKWADDLI